MITRPKLYFHRGAGVYIAECSILDDEDKMIFDYDLRDGDFWWVIEIHLKKSTKQISVMWSREVLF